MAEKKAQQKTSPVDSREALLQAAQRVFAKKGFEGATVKDLADEAGVNISLVSYHFGGKDGLYRTCIQNFGEQRLEATERILQAASSKEDFTLRLRLFAADILEMFSRNHDSCKIINRGLENMDNVTLDVFKSVFFRIFGALHGFVEHGQRTGFVRADCDTEIVTALMFGSIMHLNRSQDIARALGRRTLDEPVYKAQVIEHWVRTHTEGIFSS